MSEGPEVGDSCQTVTVVSLSAAEPDRDYTGGDIVTAEWCQGDSQCDVRWQNESAIAGPGPRRVCTRGHGPESDSRPRLPARRRSTPSPGPGPAPDRSRGLGGPAQGLGARPGWGPGVPAVFRPGLLSEAARGPTEAQGACDMRTKGPSAGAATVPRKRGIKHCRMSTTMARPADATVTLPP